MVDHSLYSETDESDSDKPKIICTEKPTEQIKKFGSLKKFTSKRNIETSPSTSTSLDRKWFFHKSGTHSKNALPIPTAQFRSYRKIRTTNTDTGSISTGNFTSHVPIFASCLETSTLSQMQNISVPNLTLDHLIPKNAEESLNATVKSKTREKNYTHASNPSLCVVSDAAMSNFSKPRSLQQENENLAGFVTLEELMNRQAEERKLNPHCITESTSVNLNSIRPDVVYGKLDHLRISFRCQLPFSFLYSVLKILCQTDSTHQNWAATDRVHVCWVHST